MTKVTNEEFVERVFKLVGKEYTPLTQYITSGKHVKMRHNICNETYNVSPSNFYAGYRCPHCSKRASMDTNKFSKKIDEIFNGEIKVIGEYKTNHTKIEVKHLKCNKTFDVRPSNILQGYGCPHCARNKKRTIEDIKDEIYELTDGEYECLSNEYINNREKLTMFHNDCNKEYDVTWSNFKQGYRCPHCSKINNSRGVKIIKKYLDSNNINYEQEVKVDGCINPETNTNLRFDFYLPDYNLYIEYDGEQHFKPTGNFFTKERFEKIKYLDNLKNEFCAENDLDLVRFNYKQLKNLKKIIEDFFKELNVQRPSL